MIGWRFQGPKTAPKLFANWKKKEPTCSFFKPRAHHGPSLLVLDFLLGGEVPFLKSHIMCFCGCFIMRNHHFAGIGIRWGFFVRNVRNVGGATHPHAHSPEAYLATSQLLPLPRTWIGEGQKGWKQDETGCFNRIFFLVLRVVWTKHHPKSSLFFFLKMMLIIATRVEPVNMWRVGDAFFSDWWVTC